MNMYNPILVWPSVSLFVANIKPLKVQISVPDTNAAMDTDAVADNEDTDTDT